MIVYCNIALAQESWEKNKIAADYLSGLIYHFQELDFGTNINQIAYMAVGGDANFRISYEEGIKYRKKNKTIESVFFMDYTTLTALEQLPLVKYIGEQLISESVKFKNLNIHDFYLDKYIASLESYLLEAKELIQQGISPSAGKKLNDDIQEAMTKKYLRL